MSDSPRRDEVLESRSPVGERPRQDSQERRGRSRSRDGRRGGSRDNYRRMERERDEASGNVVYVAKLARDTRESDLHHGFKQFGNIKSIVQKSSYAFITFEKPESAADAIAKMNGAKFVNEEVLLVEQSGT